jgi:hypothetical protein
MTREQIRAEADQAAQEFAEQIAQSENETTGIPKPVKIIITETETDVEPFGLNFEAPETASEAPAAGDGGGGGEPPPEPCPLTSIVISGVSINPGCYVGDNGACTNQWSNTWQDVSLNGDATIVRGFTLNDYCGGTAYSDDDCIWIFNTGIIRVYNHAPNPNPDYPDHSPDPFLPSHCDHSPPPAPYDSVVEGAVMRLAGHWYATIRNTDYGPAANSVPFIIFEGNSATTTIPNGISGFDTSCTQYSFSGVIDDIYWGNCSSGSGTDNWALLAAGGSIVVTV